MNGLCLKRVKAAEEAQFADLYSWRPALDAVFENQKTVILCGGGWVGAAYTVPEDPPPDCKVIIEKDGQPRQHFDLAGDGTVGAVPLTMGGGTYKITVARQVWKSEFYKAVGGVFIDN